MMPPGRTMVLNLELQIPPTAVKPSNSVTFHGIIDYTAGEVGKSDVGGAVVWFVRLSPYLAIER